MYSIETKDVVKQFSGHLALDNISIQVPEASIFGLLGPNGAGKTTLIRIINQITMPDSGEVNFMGRKLLPEDVYKIGYLPEERGLYKKMKVGDQCMYLAQLKGLSKSEAKKRLMHWFEKFEISAWWDKKVEELSKGMAQKIQFITTVLHEPKLLILDEPFSGFDPINVELVRKEIIRLKEEGTTIILSTHNMGSVEEMCDNIALINHSQVVLDGAIKQIKEDFKSHKYELQFKGNILGFTNSLWTNFDLEEVESEDDFHTCRIELLNNKSLNDLLQIALPHVEIIGVNEIIPSVNDIFINVVNKNQEERA